MGGSTMMETMSPFPQATGSTNHGVVPHSLGTRSPCCKSVSTSHHPYWVGANMIDGFPQPTHGSVVIPTSDAIIQFFTAHLMCVLAGKFWNDRFCSFKISKLSPLHIFVIWLKYQIKVRKKLQCGLYSDIKKVAGVIWVLATLTKDNWYLYTFARKIVACTQFAHESVKLSTGHRSAGAGLSPVRLDSASIDYHVGRFGRLDDRQHLIPPRSYIT